MMAEKDKVSLIMQGYDSACLKIGHLREKRGKHAPDPMTEHCVEIVHYQLRINISRKRSMVEDLFSQFYSGDSESCRGPIW